MKPKVLFVSINFFSPEFLDGANKITYNLLQQDDLYDPSFLSLYSGSLDKDEIEKFAHVDIRTLNHKSSPSIRKLGKVMRWIMGKPFVSLPLNEAKKLSRQIDEIASEFDAIHLTSLSLASCLKYLSNSTAKKITLGATDSYGMFTERRIDNESNIIKKTLLKRELNLSRPFEKQAYSLAPKTIFVSHVDEEYSRKNFPEGNFFNIPLGVDTDYFHPAPRGTKINPHQIIFTGNLNYAPNRDACNFLTFEVLPLLKKEIPDIRLILAGANPPSEVCNLNNPSILVTDKVPDLRPYIWESALYVCPLRFGAGMKNKVLEASSMAINGIYTEVSIDGIRNIKFKNLIMQDEISPEVVKDLIIRVLSRPSQEDELCIREDIIAKYSWRAQALKFQSFFREPRLNFKKTK